MSLTDRELKHMWRRYQTTLEEAVRLARELTLYDQATTLKIYADQAQGLADCFHQAVEKDRKHREWEQIKGIIGGG